MPQQQVVTACFRNAVPQLGGGLRGGLREDRTPVCFGFYSLFGDESFERSSLSHSADSTMTIHTQLKISDTHNSSRFFTLWFVFRSSPLRSRSRSRPSQCPSSFSSPAARKFPPVQCPSARPPSLSACRGLTRFP